MTQVLPFFSFYEDEAESRSKQNMHGISPELYPAVFEYIFFSKDISKKLLKTLQLA